MRSQRLSLKQNVNPDSTVVLRKIVNEVFC